MKAHAEVICYKSKVLSDGTYPLMLTSSEIMPLSCCAVIKTKFSSVTFIYYTVFLVNYSHLIYCKSNEKKHAIFDKNEKLSTK